MSKRANEIAGLFAQKVQGGIGTIRLTRKQVSWLWNVFNQEHTVHNNPPIVRGGLGDGRTWQLFRYPNGAGEFHIYVDDIQ